MSNCRPGDLARVIGIHHCPENLGAIVHVIEQIMPGDTINVGGAMCAFRPTYPTLRYWLVEGVSRQLHAWSHKRGSVLSHVAASRDDYLEPLRPDEAGVDEMVQIVGLPSQPVKDPA